MSEGHAGEWETVIGLEVHAQVISKAKLFSGAATAISGPSPTPRCRRSTPPFRACCR